MIPASMIDPIANQIQGLYPDPNFAGDNGANVNGANVIRNYVRQQNRTFDRNNYDFKMNYNPMASMQVWGKYSRMGANVNSPQHTLATTVRWSATRPSTWRRSAPHGR